jgi:hypothetical protein
MKVENKIVLFISVLALFISSLSFYNIYFTPTKLDIENRNRNSFEYNLSATDEWKEFNITLNGKPPFRIYFETISKVPWVHVIVMQGFHYYKLNSTFLPYSDAFLIMRDGVPAYRIGSDTQYKENFHEWYYEASEFNPHYNELSEDVKRTQTVYTVKTVIKNDIYIQYRGKGNFQLRIIEIT